jgi:hypothetical protein
LKKCVPTKRSRIRLVLATMIAGIAMMMMKEVTSIDHMNSGMRSSDMPGSALRCQALFRGVRRCLSVGCPTLPKRICRTAPVGCDVEYQRESSATIRPAKAVGTKIITACLHDNRLFHDCS